jgi:hypothetical protein
VKLVSIQTKDPGGFQALGVAFVTGAVNSRTLACIS